MRKIKKRNKRRSFGSVFLRRLAAALALSCVLILVYFEAGSEVILRSANDSWNSYYNNIMQYISLNEKEKKPNVVEFRFSLNSGFSTIHEDMSDSEILGRFGRPINDNCYAAAAIYDKDGNVLLDNHIRMFAVVKLSKDDERNGIYEYDPETAGIPEVNEMIRKYSDFPKSKNYIRGIHMDSVYIDTETFDFIPHEIHCSLDDYDGTRVYEDSYTIECNDPRYELVEMNTDKEHNLPRAMTIICGEQPELVEKGLSDQKIGGYGWVLHDLSPTVRVYERKMRVIYQGEDAELYSYVKVDIDNRLNRLFFLTGSAAIVVLMVFAAMLLSWRRYTIDKADCAMEDYQRSITNNLAHDIKTPLAAIGGYAENLGEMLKDGGDEKQQRYAQSIMDNVTRIDEVINRALKLNKIDQADKLSVCSMSLRSITEECIKRYADQLESRGITYKTEGDAEVKADKEMMQTAIDNLISNAAKYTRTDGEIKVTIDKRRMKVVNTVSGRIETAELKKPFVRGDKARTDRSGSGLGLSIAESALARNGFGLKISSTETEFTAEIRL